MNKDMNKDIMLPITLEDIKSIKSGDFVYLTGEIYTARDAAHERLYKAILAGEDIPIPLNNATIYYLGPSPNRPDRTIGSAGPTTSSRMDKYTPLLLEQGLKGMIGKGIRNKEVVEAIKEYKGVYFAAVGGAGALLSRCIKKCEVIAYDDLGAEAIHKLEIEKFPVVVVNDCLGNDYYEQVLVNDKL